MIVISNKDCSEHQQCDVFSIVVPTYNEQKFIGALISRILEFDVDGFSIELIIVDNGSDDDTVTIARKFPCTVYQLPQATIAAMRNFAAKKSKGTWIGFIDADCMPVREWALYAKTQLDTNPDIGIVGSFYSVGPRKTWVECYWQAMRSAIVGRVRFLPAGNIALRRGEFLELGGFSEHLATGEDYELCQRYIKNGLSVVNNPLLKSIHFGNPHNVFEVLRKERWYGLSGRQSWEKNLQAKVFWATCIFALGSFFSLTASAAEFLWSSDWLRSMAIASMFGPVSVVSTYAAIATRRAGKVNMFLGYLLIFIFYFLGRTLAFYDIVRGKK